MVVTGAPFSIKLSCFVLFCFLFTSQYIHRDLPVLFVSSLDYWGTELCRGLPNVIFHSCCQDSNPYRGNAIMVYQHLNNDGHPDPQLGQLDSMVEIIFVGC